MMKLPGSIHTISSGTPPGNSMVISSLACASVADKKMSASTRFILASLERGDANFQQKRYRLTYCNEDMPFTR